jgi:hypothetical protein
MARYRIVHDPREAPLAFKVQVRFWWFFWETINWAVSREGADACVREDAKWKAVRRAVVWEGEPKP